MTDVKAALASLGWRVNTPARLTQAIRHFQGMWNLGPALAVDGKAGPQTEGALAVSLIRKASGLGDISPNFSAVEFQCNCGEDGRTVADDCDRIWTPRSTVQMAERFRTLVGPFTPERACRCERENRRVGGAKSSQHLLGRGLDVPIYTVTVTQVRKATGCDGVGTYEKNGRLYVRHIDNRGSWAQWPYPPKPFTPLTPRPDLAVTTPEEDPMADYAAQLDRIEGNSAAAKQESNFAHIHAKQANAKGDANSAAIRELAAGLGPTVQAAVEAALAADYEAELTLTKKETT